MGDVELVIKIDSYVLEHCKRHVKEHYANNIEKAIANGTTLPKGCDIQRIIPKKVDVQKWTHTECPNQNCNCELSTYHGDGYYTIDLKPDFCPNCGQALLWESEE